MLLDMEVDYHSKDKALVCTVVGPYAGVDAVGSQHAELVETVELWDWLCIVDQPYRRAHLKVLLEIQRPKSGAGLGVPGGQSVKLRSALAWVIDSGLNEGWTKVQHEVVFDLEVVVCG
jgi:hypothetical protein